jgi:hypothetical protein
MVVPIPSYHKNHKNQLISKVISNFDVGLSVEKNSHKKIKLYTEVTHKNQSTNAQLTN